MSSLNQQRLNLISGKLNYLAVEAGKLIMEIYNDVADIEITNKTDNSPLTQADLAAHNYLVKHLGSVYNCPVISEESPKEDQSYDNRRELDFYWLVDPLDGTKEFIKRNGQFTVNIALMELIGTETHPVVSVVYTPVTNECCYAMTGLGAYYIGSDNNIKKLPDSHILGARNKNPLKIVVSNSHSNPATEEYLKRFTEINIERIPLGSSLKFTAVAMGHADLYPRLTPCMEWDTAAADLVVREAGGTVWQLVQNESGEWHQSIEPIKYNKPNLLQPFFVCRLD